MTDAEFKKWLADHTLFNETLPRVNGPKLEFTITDMEGFTAWCAGRDMTVAQYEEHLRKQITPADPFDRLVMDKGED